MHDEGSPPKKRVTLLLDQELYEELKGLAAPLKNRAGPSRTRPVVAFGKLTS